MTQHDDAHLDDLIAHLGDGDSKDLFRRLLERGMQELIEAELTATIGAELHERTDTRTNQRNGGRSRTLSTPAGDIELRIPKLRVGSFFPELVGAAPSCRPGLVGGDHDRLHHRHLHPQGRRSGPSARV